MRENGLTPNQAVFKEYINLEKRYSTEAFENLSRGVAGDRGELTRFFRGMIFLKLPIYQITVIELSKQLQAVVFIS